MKIFSTHHRKLEPRRRFGGLEFRSKVKSASNYKRVFNEPKINIKLWRNIGIAALLVVIYFLTLSPYFVIADVQVSGNQEISSQTISDVIRSKKARLFFLPQGRVNQILTDALPNIKVVTSSTRTWPNKISIIVKERTPGFVIKSNGKFFLVDDEGTVVSSIDDPKNLIVVEDQIIEDFATAENLPNMKFAGFIISINKLWPSKITTTIALSKFPGKASNDVQLETAEGWSVFFDTSRSAVSQLNDLSLILKQKVDAKNRSQLAYIDLRLSKYAYICFKATACVEQPQSQVSGDTTSAE